MIILIILATLLPLLTFAQTEIEGEVSGEWTAEDSPYIVVDSTWIPEDEELRIGPGVDVLFGEGLGLDVFGTLTAEGTEDDSVRIRVVDDVEHWRGIRFYGSNRTEWNYASIICPDSAFVLDQSCSLTMNNCLIDADRTIAGDTYYGIRSGNLTFSQSILRSKSHHTATGGRLNANRTLFDFGGDEGDNPGFWSRGTSFWLTSCEVIGALHAEEGIVIADSCRFLRTPLGRVTGVGLGDQEGRLTESYVEGRVSAGTMDSQDVVTLHNNTLLGNLSLCGRADVLGCNIGGRLNIDFGESITIRNSIINESLYLSNSNSVTIDSCFFIPVGQNHYFFSASDISYFTVERCVLDLLIFIRRIDEALFDHNTIIPNSDSSRTFSGMNTFGNISWTNNIFINPFHSGLLFSGDNLPRNIEYNCIWGFEYAGGQRNDPISLDVLDSTNVIANPLIGWDGIIPYISFNSPCIDSGDPEFDLDLDSTQSDIGAIAYDPFHYIFRPSEEVRLPETFSINAFPNPFNNSCKLTYELPFSTEVSIVLYDGMGRFVKEVLRQNQSTGYHDCLIEATDLPTGVYFAKFSTEKYQQNLKLLLIR